MTESAPQFAYQAPAYFPVPFHLQNAYLTVPQVTTTSVPDAASSSVAPIIGPVYPVAYSLPQYQQALVDAPDMLRGQVNFKRLSLTDIKIDIPRVPKKKTLISAMEAADVKKKWENSSWGRKLIVQKRRASLNDFDRFKVMLAKIKRGGAIRQELAKLKKEKAT